MKNIIIGMVALLGPYICTEGSPVSIAPCVSNQTVRLDWPGEGGVNYEVQGRSVLTTGNWTDTTFHLGRNETVSVGKSAVASSGFFRVTPRKSPGIHVARDGEHQGRFVFFNEEGERVPLRAFGVNYFDAFTRYNQNGDDLSFIDGFAYLQANHIPVARVMAGGFWPKEWHLYFSDPEEYFRRLDRFFSEAEAHGIGLIINFFWNNKTIGEVVNQAVEAGLLTPGIDFVPNDPLHLDKNGDPTYAEYTTDLGRENSGTIAWIRHYTRQIVERYGDSSAVWGWEFANEINNELDLPNLLMRERKGSILHQGMYLPATTNNFEILPPWTGPDDLTRAHVEVAKRIFAETIRSIDTWRFIKSGDSRPRPSAYHNWTEHSWTADNRAQNLSVMPIDNPDPMDTVTVHLYPGTPSGGSDTYFPNDDPVVIQWRTGQYKELLEHYKTGADAIGKPLILGEWGAQGDGTTEEEKETFHRFMQAIIDAEVQLSLVWSFDNTNIDQTNTYWVNPGTPKEYQLANDDPDLWDLRKMNEQYGSFPAVPPPENLPSAPSALAASAVSSSHVNLTWSDHSNNEAGFRIERRIGTIGLWGEIATVVANVTSYDDIGLAANTTYGYRVRAYNAAGNSAFTAAVSATTAPWRTGTYSDDFDRANGALGGKWMNTGYVAEPLAGFNIQSNRVVRTGGASALAWNTMIQTLNVGGQSFAAAVTTTLNTTADSGWIGIAFNVRDPSNYYYLRYNGSGNVQLLRVVHGQGAAFYNPAGVEFTHVQNRAYRLEVFSDTAYTFNISITDTTTGAVVYSANDITDLQGNFTGGYAGIWGGSGLRNWDDFSIEKFGDAGIVEVCDYLGAPQMLINGTPQVPMQFMGFLWDGPRYSTANTTRGIKRVDFTVPSVVTGPLEIRLGCGNVRNGPGESCNISIYNVRLFQNETLLRSVSLNAASLFIHPNVTTINATISQQSDHLLWNVTANPAGSRTWMMGHMHIKFPIDSLSLNPGNYFLEFDLVSDTPTYVGMDIVRPQSGDQTLLLLEDGQCVEQVQLAAARGVHQHMIDFPIPWDNGNMADVDRRMEAVIAADPQAMLMVRFGVFPSQTWFNQNPDEWMTYQDGRRHRMATTSSSKWLLDLEPRLAAYIEHIEENWGDRVLAYHPNAYGGGEWNYAGARENDNTGYGPVVESDFHFWLGEQYGTDQALRAAWGQPNVTLADAPLPTYSQRVTSTRGEFLHPTNDRYLLDFYLFRNERMADAIEFVAATIKDASQRRRPVQFFYGYTFEVHDSVVEAGHALWERLINCPDIDSFCAPTAYFDRRPGKPGFFHAPVDSVALHGKMWFNEDDTYSYLGPKDPNTIWHPTTLIQNIHNYQRNFAHLFVRRMGTWYMDIPGRGMLNSPGLWNAIGDLRNYWETHKDEPVTFNPRIVLVADERSVYYTPFYQSSRDPSVHRKLLADLRGRVGNIGAPVGYYLLQDVLADRVEADVYIFANTLALSAADRDALRAQLARRGATAVWMYAPGVIDPAAGTLADAHIGLLIGMDAVALSSPVKDTLKPTQAALNMVPGLANFGSGKTNLLSQWRLFSSSGMTPLAVYNDRQSDIAMGMTTKDGFTSVYCAGLDVPTALLRKLAEDAGVWIYNNQGDAIVADDNFLMIHAASQGLKTIRFPKSGVITDALTGQTLATGNQVQIQMNFTETRLFRIEIQ